MLTSRCNPMSRPYFLGGFSTCILIGCCNLKTFDTLPSAAITNSMIRLHRCYWYRCYRFLSASLSVTFVHCAQTAEDIDTIYFAYDSLSADSIKIWVTYRSTHSCPNFAPKWPTTVDLSIRDIRWQLTKCTPLFIK